MPEDNRTSDWSDIIRRQGEKSAARRKERVAKLKSGTVAQETAILKMSAPDLLEFYHKAILGCNCYDIAEREVWEHFVAYTKAEILERIIAR